MYQTTTIWMLTQHRHRHQHQHHLKTRKCGTATLWPGRLICAAVHDIVNLIPTLFASFTHIAHPSSFAIRACGIEICTPTFVTCIPGFWNFIFQLTMTLDVSSLSNRTGVEAKCHTDFGNRVLLYSRGDKHAETVVHISSRYR